MARRRVIDWKKVRAFLRKRGFLLRRKKKPLGWPIALTWFGILACADDFGMGEWSVTDVAMVFMEKELAADEISLREVAQIMETFTGGADPSVIIWEHEGRTIYVLPKHQNYQNVHSPQNADTPFPGPEIFAKLSPRMRRHFRKNFTKFTTFSDPLFRPEVEGEVEEEVEEEDADSRKPADRCGWCEHPKAATAAPSQRLLQTYHDLYREIHHTCPTMVPGRDAKVLNQVLATGKDPERVRAVIAHGLRSEDRYLVSRGFALSVIASNFDGIALALDGGFVHGGQRAPGGPPRRPAPASAEEFGTEGGRVKL